MAQAVGDAPVDVAVATRPSLIRDVVCRALAARLDLRVVDFEPGPDGDPTRRLQQLQPRVLIIDDEGSVANREAVVRRLLRASPSTRILVLTARYDDAARRRFVSAGAYGVIQSRSDLSDLARAVDAASVGKPCAPAGVSEPAPSWQASRRRAVRPETDSRLTRREWEVAELVAKGLRNKSIALRLNISVDTVKSHLNHSFRKLKLDGRMGLALLAQSRLRSTTDM
jgi:DNA-binding NarL/FixJ family response regulator